RGVTVPPRHYEDIKSADGAAYAEMFRKLLAQGIAFAPSAFEVGFISAAHQQNHLDATIHMLDRALARE
ncbi:MAG TPA: aspartate aminotransferase family protein, partial [Myxococcota bacterium]|nr:aspartate aminotransferase family protein [Myxococcota bacterium]